MAVVRKTSANLYDKKRIQFKKCCIDMDLQEGNVVVDIEEEGNSFV